MRIVQKQIAHSLGLPAPTPTTGFGLTITNKKVAILLWRRVFTLWKAD